MRRSHCLKPRSPDLQGRISGPIQPLPVPTLTLWLAAKSSQRTRKPLFFRKLALFSMRACCVAPSAISPCHPRNDRQGTPSFKYDFLGTKPGGAEFWHIGFL